MKNNLEQKIEEIFKKHFLITNESGSYDVDWNNEVAYEMIQELSSLLKESNEEAVIGFGNWLEDNHTDYGYVAMSDFGYEYLNGSINPIAKAQEEMYENIKQNETPEAKPQDNIELKREFEESLVGKYFFSEDETWWTTSGCPEWRVGLKVWEWFLPHLKDDNKIRRDTLMGFEKYCVVGRDALGFNESDIRTLQVALKFYEEYLKKEEDGSK